MRYYKVGRIVNTFGIRGEIKLIADTDFPKERFKKGNPLYILKDNSMVQSVTVESSRLAKGTYILKFKEFNYINEVETFKNHWLAISEEQQEELDDHQYYYHEIVGLNVYTTDNECLGTVRDIEALGSNDVWVVQSNQPGKRDILLPYIEDVVLEVDLELGRVIVDLMEGLIPDEN